MDKGNRHYTLHAAPGSCSLAPHILLEEIGDDYTLALMSPGHPETKTEAFRKLNPKGRIPVLTAENLLITEVPAILVHLAMESPDTGLLGADSFSLVRALEWCNWLSGSVHAVAVRMIWRPDYFCDPGDAHPDIRHKGKEHLDGAYAFIEARLTERSWALGESYSIVDPYLAVFYRWGMRMNIDMPRVFPCWTAHTRRIEVRPAVQRALQQEGISLWH